MIRGIRDCTLIELAKCQQPGPANFVLSLYDYIRNNTACSSFNDDLLIPPIVQHGLLNLDLKAKVGL